MNIIEFSSMKPFDILDLTLKCVFIFKFASDASLLENRKILIFSITYLKGDKMGLKKKEITQGP